MNERPPGHALARGAVSALIVVVLTMQCLAGFKVLCPPKRFEWLQRFRIACAPTLWPFLDYNMYNGARYPGWVGTQRTVVARLGDGEELAVEPADVGLNPFDYSRWFVDDVVDGRARSAVERLARSTGREGDAVALRVDTAGWRLEADGSFTPLPVERGRWLELPASGTPR